MSRTRKPIPAEAFEHGDPRRYHRGCRCQKCTKNKSFDVARWQYLRDTGRPGRVPIDLAHKHLLRLQAAGMPNQEIMRAARLTTEMLGRIARREGKILHSTQTRVLAVPLPDKPARTMRCTDGTGTRRRLQALIASGWTRASIAKQVDGGIQKEYVRYLLRTTGPVTTWTAARIAEVYAKLADQKPEDHGVTTRHAQAARQEAAAKEWIGPEYWDPDTIDDPDFEPAVKDTPRYIALAEDGLELEQRQGYTRHQAAERLGVTKIHLQASITRYRKTLEEAA